MKWFYQSNCRQTADPALFLGSTFVASVWYSCCPYWTVKKQFQVVFHTQSTLFYYVIIEFLERTKIRSVFPMPVSVNMCIQIIIYLPSGTCSQVYVFNCIAQRYDFVEMSNHNNEINGLKTTKDKRCHLITGAHSVNLKEVFYLLIRPNDVWPI